MKDFTRKQMTEAIVRAILRAETPNDVIKNPNAEADEIMRRVSEQSDG